MTTVGSSTLCRNCQRPFCEHKISLHGLYDCPVGDSVFIASEEAEPQPAPSVEEKPEQPLSAVGPLRWANGGDVNFMTGLGFTAPDARPDERGRPGRFRFVIPPNDEVLRIEENGQCYVRGELVQTNRQVFDAFLAWLNHVTAYYYGNAPNPEN
jgi:hypothetical protein